MSAEILYFRPRYVTTCPYGDFRKALMVVTLLEDFSPDEAVEAVAFWVAQGLVSEDEVDALHVFYEWK